LTVEQVVAVLTEPEETTIGQTAVEYDAIVDGRPLHVVVVRDSAPPLVITVFDKDR
jgi:hypothetical protein